MKTGKIEIKKPNGSHTDVLRQSLSAWTLCDGSAVDFTIALTERESWALLSARCCENDVEQ